MRYTGSLVKKEREQIFELFLDRTKFKFSDIEKALGIRSNALAYHLTMMQKDGLLEKRGENYHLTKTAERYIPIFSHITGQQLGPVPVVIVACVDKDRILMIRRRKRPYKGYWTCIGGKMLLEESFEDASIRHIKTKTGLEPVFGSINAVLHERVEGDGIIKHSFILFFTTVSAKGAPIKSEDGPARWFKIDGLDEKNVVPSDLWLIKNRLGKKIALKSAMMKENDGELSEFRLI
jgi:ADP-ribose pyrophosphatase YjhB (NUDIX family)